MNIQAKVVVRKRKKKKTNKTIRGIFVLSRIFSMRLTSILFFEGAN